MEPIGPARVERRLAAILAGDVAVAVSATKEGSCSVGDDD
jgi:hypothetical protein